MSTSQPSDCRTASPGLKSDSQQIQDRLGTTGAATADRPVWKTARPKSSKWIAGASMELCGCYRQGERDQSDPEESAGA